MEELSNEHRMSPCPRAADRDIPCKQGKLKTDNRHIVNPHKIIYCVAWRGFRRQCAAASRSRPSLVSASAVRRVAGCSSTQLVGGDWQREAGGSRAG
jgi:hypothetical protein